MSNWERKELLDGLVEQRAKVDSIVGLRRASSFYRNFGHARVAFEGVSLDKHESRYVGRRLLKAANRKGGESA